MLRRTIVAEQVSSQERLTWEEKKKRVATMRLPDDENNATQNHVD